MLYDTDFAKWAEEQAAHLTEGRFDLLDMGNLIEEVADLGRRQHDAVKSQLVRLLIHLLKLTYSQGAQEPHRQWRVSIIDAQSNLLQLLEDNPSIRSHLETYLLESYQRACKQASRELAAYDETHEPFPATCPWTVEQVLDEMVASFMSRRNAAH
jgi:hypothetical protein